MRFYRQCKHKVWLFWLNHNKNNFGDESESNRAYVEELLNKTEKSRKTLWFHLCAKRIRQNLFCSTAIVADICCVSCFFFSSFAYIRAHIHKTFFCFFFCLLPSAEKKINLFSTNTYAWLSVYVVKTRLRLFFFYLASARRDLWRFIIKERGWKLSRTYSNKWKISATRLNHKCTQMHLTQCT